MQSSNPTLKTQTFPQLKWGLPPDQLAKFIAEREELFRTRYGFNIPRKKAV